MLELWERVEDCRASITPNECKNLYRSMPKRIAVVITAKGSGQIFNFVPACVSKAEFWIELHFIFCLYMHTCV
jgi:hypothetical protein